MDQRDARDMAYDKLLYERRTKLLGKSTRAFKKDKDFDTLVSQLQQLRNKLLVCPAEYEEQCIKRSHDIRDLLQTANEEFALKNAYIKCNDLLESRQPLEFQKCQMMEMGKFKLHLDRDFRKFQNFYNSVNNPDS